MRNEDRSEASEDYLPSGHSPPLPPSPAAAPSNNTEVPSRKTERLVANHTVLHEFADDVASLWCQYGTIPVWEDGPPTPLEFLRDHVAISRPCLIRKAFCSHTNPSEPLTLTLDQLCELFMRHPPTATDADAESDDASCPPLRLQVDVTPDGHGDCLRRVRTTLDVNPIGKGATSNVKDDNDTDDATVTTTCFVKPQTVDLTLDEFRQRLRRKPAQDARAGVEDCVFAAMPRNFRAGEPQPEVTPVEGEGVVYYSRQNDCLRLEVAPLWDLHLFPERIPWAEAAFQLSSRDGPSLPDAVNLWIGNECAVSALHKDHYENLFYVLSGEKVFTLCPPGDACFLEEQRVPSGTFEWDGAEWKVRLDADGVGEGQPATSSPTVPWIATDVTVPLKGRPPNDLARLCHPLTVKVRAGEMLYLPALWFHRVTQTCETVAINYWYDMRFESPNWCYFRLLQQLRRD